MQKLRDNSSPEQIAAVAFNRQRKKLAIALEDSIDVLERLADSKNLKVNILIVVTNKFTNIVIPLEKRHFP